MSIILALALRPTDVNVPQFERLYDGYMTLYDGISIVTPSDVDMGRVDLLRSYDRVRVLNGAAGVENRRYRTLQQALEFEDVAAVHYCDGDHALNRFERDPDDWHMTVDAIRDVDCLIIGRTQAVFESYPPALYETERIINDVVSHLLGQRVDLGSGARGFSRAAAEYIIAQDSPASHPVAVDAAWPVMLDTAGFTVGTVLSNGAYYDVSNEATRQRLESKTQWIKRVEMAREIIAAGIRAAEGRYGA